MYDCSASKPVPSYIIEMSEIIIKRNYQCESSFYHHFNYEAVTFIDKRNKVPLSNEM